MPDALTPTMTHTPSDSEHVYQTALQSLLQMGLRVAAVAARLAEVEGTAVEALSVAAAQAAAAVPMPDSLAGAVEAGRIADASEAARDAAAGRMASITLSFERAARAVRRTVALARRIEDGRPFGPIVPAAAAPGFAPRAAGPHRDEAARETLADRLDPPEPDDALAGRPVAELLAAICRDLGVGMAPDGEDGLALAVPPAFGDPGAALARPGAGRAREPGCRPGMPWASAAHPPDT